MKTTIHLDMLCLFNIHLKYNDLTEEEKKNNKFYSFLNSLETLSFDEEVFVMNSNNINKINDFFNTQEKCDSVGKEIIKLLGLKKYVDFENFNLLDLENRNNNLIAINCILSVNIFEVSICEKINNNKQKLFDIIKSTEQQPRFFNCNNIELFNLEINNKNILSMTLKCSYNVNVDPFSYMQSFKNKLVYVSAEKNNNVFKMSIIKKIFEDFNDEKV